MNERERCASRAPRRPLKEGMTVEAAEGHPYWRYALRPGARCELVRGHPELRHRNGLLRWYDPPLVLRVDAEGTIVSAS